MKPIGEAQLKKQISSGELLNTYVIFGTETYLKQHYVNKIIQKAVGNADAFNYVRFDGNVDVRELNDAVSQLPFLCEKRCVVVCDFDVEAARADLLEGIYAILDQQVETTVLIFWFDTVEVNPKKAPKLTRLVERCEKNRGAGVQLDQRSESELMKLLKNSAEKRGCRMEPTVCRHMLEVCGRDLLTLQSELEKLCFYAPGESISREMVDRVCVRTIDASVYDLTRAIHAKNADRAMEIIADLFFEKVEPVVILSVLSGCYIDMYRARAAENAGLKPREIANDFGYYGRGFVLDNASAAARGLTMAQLSACLGILMEADRALKSTRAQDKAGYARTMLEQTVVRLMLCQRRTAR